MNAAAQQKSRRVAALATSISARTGFAGTTYLKQSSSSYISNKSYARETDKTSRIAALATMFGTAALEKAAPRTASPRRSTAQPLPPKGWPPKTTVYRVEDLVGWWRFLWNRHMRGVDMPQVPYFYMRQHLLGWLKHDGHQLVEDTLEFAFQHWERIRSRVQRLADADGPTLQILFAYRNMFREMKAKLNEPKAWASTWRETDFDSNVEVLEAI